MPLSANWTAGQQFTASAENAVEAAVNANTAARTLSGTYASLPAASSSSGALYFCTDTDAVYYSNGTSWTKIRVAGASGTNLSDVPSGMTSFNLGTSTLSSSGGDRLLTIPTVAGDNLRGEYQTLTPTSGYTAQAYIALTTAVNTAAVYSGLLIGSSSAGTFINFGPTWNSTLNNYGISVTKWSSQTSFSAHYANTLSTSQIQTLPRWFRIRDDGTNRNYEYSYDNIDWFAATTATSRTDFLTADRVGWGGYNTSPSGTVKIRNRSFLVTSP